MDVKEKEAVVEEQEFYTSMKPTLLIFAVTDDENQMECKNANLRTQMSVVNAMISTMIIGLGLMVSKMMKNIIVFCDH